MSGKGGKDCARFDVLILDDDEAVLETTAAIVEEHHDVFATTRPTEALDKLRARRFHVILVDWMMPGMDGIEFFRRASRLDPDVACLIMTGRVNEFTVEVARDDRKLLGVIGKPFTPAQLLDRIAQFGGLSKMKKQVRALKAR
jgi:CheY-like chemotaxis protein